MTQFNFETPDDLWKEWKNSFDRDQPIDDRLRQLIRADLEGGLFFEEPDLAGEEVLNQQAKLSLGGEPNGERPIRYAIKFLDEEPRG